MINTINSTHRYWGDNMTIQNKQKQSYQKGYMRFPENSSCIYSSVCMAGERHVEKLVMEKA